MNKVVFSLVLALSLVFSAFFPFVYAAAAEPQGVEAAESSLSDLLDNDEVIDFLITFLDYVSQANDLASSSDDPYDVLKVAMDTMFLDLIQYGISLIPGGDFINLIGAWCGLNDFSITDHFTSKFIDLFNSGKDDMQDFYDLCILPCYGSIDNFVDDMYGDSYTPGSNTPALPTGDPVAAIGDGAGNFITGFLVPFWEWCVNSEIILAFLAVDFVIFGFSILSRSVWAFGRGR